MHTTSALIVATTLIAVGVGEPAIHRPRVAPNRDATAMVRLGNQLTASRSVTLRANGIVLFSDVAAGTMTDYVAQTDSVVMFSIRATGDTADVGTRQAMSSNGWYSVIAMNGPDNKPTVMVRRDSVRRE